MEYRHLDSTNVSAHQHSALAKREGKLPRKTIFEASRTKIHALVDALGNPVVFQNAHDVTLAIGLLEQVNLQDVNVMADCAYGSNATRDYISDQGEQYTIPPKINLREKWKVDWGAV